MSLHRLLLFDRDPALLERVTGVLRQHDRTIEGVQSGRDALDHLRQASYDVVIAGQGSNGFDGMKLLRRARVVRPEAKVIVTGDRSPERAIAALRAQAYSYVHQPAQPGPLAELVHHAIASSSWRDDLRILSARPEWVTLDVRCKMQAAERATHFFRELLVDISPAVAEDVMAAFRELLINAVEHGGHMVARKRARVSFLRTAQSLMVHIQDPGKGFSLERIDHAAVGNPHDDPTRHAEIRAERGQRPGGFGILMASKMVDSLLYNERGNEVFFVKNLA